MSTAGPRDIIAPCPFCGGTANVYIYECQDPFVGCNGGRGDVACDANGPSMPTEAEAIARWNRRTPAAGYRVVREGKFKIGDRVTKISGSSWTGRVVGTYSTSLTPGGYAVESENEPGSVQIYPAAALRALVGEAK